MLILFNDGYPVVYFQKRIGKHRNEFTLFKFRSMYLDADKRGSITVGMRDPRITPVGFYLRKYKLDELPQLFNVLFGQMSIVGPRPELKKYVDMYTPEQLVVLNVRPGITDYASIAFHRENEILAAAADSEAEYIQKVMPEKLLLNLKYIREMSLFTDLKIIFTTVATVFIKHK